MNRLIQSVIILFVLGLFIIPAIASESAVDTNKAIIREFYDGAFNKGNLGDVDKYVTADAIEHQVVPGKTGPKTCRDNIKEYLSTFRKAFPDLKVKVEDIVAEGDKVVARCTLTGTHKGEFMGMPASGKAFSIEFIDIVRFKDGKIVEHWGVSDDAEMLRQLSTSATK